MKGMMELSVKENIYKVSASLPQNVTLIAVSKTKPVKDIKEAYEAGVRDFGENKVQEMLTKMDELNDDIRWHLIGHLQRNKVKYIAGKVFLIHSLDSIKLLNEIEKVYKGKNLTAQVLIEINIGREESKTGIFKENLEELLKACELCENVKVRGLMAVIPKGDEESCRKYFREMKNIWDELKKRNIKNVSMDYLSMGMTHDYKIAVEEGSNMVRIGEGIFGSRNYNL